MPSIQLEVHDGQQPIIIEIPSEGDFQRFQTFLAGYGQFREDASRYVFDVQRNHARYVENCQAKCLTPLDFLPYLAEVRRLTDNDIIAKYQQEQAIRESMQSVSSMPPSPVAEAPESPVAFNRGMFGLVKAKPAELTTGQCTRANGCVCDRSTPDAMQTCQFWEET